MRKRYRLKCIGIHAYFTIAIHLLSFQEVLPRNFWFSGNMPAFYSQQWKMDWENTNRAPYQ